MSKKSKVPELCKECVRFNLFKENCRVYWEGKTFCTRKCYNREEMQKMDIIV